MQKTLLRALAAVVAMSSICSSTIAARADGMENVYEHVVSGANDGIRNAIDEWHRERDAQKARERRQAAQTVSNAAQPSLPGAIAQAPPVSQQPVSEQVGLPQGLTYTADFSVAYPFGNIGTYGKTWLYGGADLSLGYGFNPTTRVLASMFQLQHWPYGFNSGLAPVYLAGFRNPVGCADLSNGNGCGPGTGRNVNVMTKDNFYVFNLEKMVFPLAHIGVPLPLVISPVYVDRSGVIGEATHSNDIVPFAFNPPDGPVFNTLPVRTAQFYSVAVTLPFLKTPKMFGTFTMATQWLVHKNGVNSQNSWQTPQVLYLEYTPTKATTLWIEPQSARDYLPTDPYPEHVVAYFAGVSQRFAKYGFVQFVLNSGGPTNMGPDNVTGIKCLTVQQALNSACGIAFGGLKATQMQLQLGIGTPGVFPL
ncbi:MAG: hypothetical protein JO241_09630 [Candidatus Eremiobacteraeota bacterium]|nr:hypothetical protein [Candidatus Eremiobacteraeota bacterium]